ncbi:MAG TPA: hypothetical protein VMW26_06425 [Methanomassiliicoccales archaeon]|nr:hypothetical protein [Methanomassiliicoccales archaeon]
MVLVDHHHRHVAITGVWHGEGGTLADVSDNGAIQRIAVVSTISRPIRDRICSRPRGR